MQDIKDVLRAVLDASALSEDEKREVEIMIMGAVRSALGRNAPEEETNDL